MSRKKGFRETTITISFGFGKEPASLLFCSVLFAATENRPKFHLAAEGNAASKVGTPHQRYFMIVFSTGSQGTQSWPD